MPIKKQSFISHHPVDPFMVDLAKPFELESCPNPAISKGSSLMNFLQNGRFQLPIRSFWGGFAAINPS
jgi:hypothetical protein